MPARINSSHWLQTAPDFSSDAVTLPARAEIAILGAGVMASALAYWLARRGQSPLAVERNPIPSAGATGRNGGLHVTGPNLACATAIEMFGRASAREIFAATILNQQLLEDVLAREAIDADYAVTGFLSLAARADEVETLRASARELSADGFPAEGLDRDAAGGFERDPSNGRIMNKSTRIPYGPDQLQFGDLRLPSGPGPYPVAIVIHGGFWLAFYDLTLMDSICAALTEAGVATWNIEYRRVGNRGGGWPGTFQDVGLAADHLRELAPRNNLDLDRVVSLGHSAGGHLALWLAGRHRIPAGNVLSSGTGGPLPLKTVVSLAGVNDLEWAARRRVGMGAVERLIGGGPDTHPERYAVGSPAALLPLGVRQVLIHGTDDDIVPFEIGRAYRDAAVARGDDVSLVALPGAGHFEVVDPGSREWPQIMSEVLKLVDGASQR